MDWKALTEKAKEGERNQYKGERSVEVRGGEEYVAKK